MNALHGRMQFRLRTAINIAVVVAVFIPLALVLALFPFAWIGDAILIVILYLVFAYVLEQRVIGIECPHCGKHIETNTPWICGFCQKTNDEGSEFPFVHRCKHCGAEPKAYQCHHRECRKLIFLSKDELETNYARCVNASIVEPQPSAEATDEEQWLREKKKMEHELMMTELSAKLDAAKRRAELDRKRSPRERLEKSFEDFHTGALGAREIAREKEKEIKVRYKDDPEMQKAALEAVEDWLRREA